MRWLAAILVSVMLMMPVAGMAEEGAGAGAPGSLTTEDVADFLEAELLEYLHELTEPRFPDMAADHWARPQVERLYRRGIIDGKGDGRFDPEGSVTRAEFLKLLTAALRMAEAPVFRGAPAGQQVPPGFVDPNHWVVTRGWFGDGIASGLLQPADYPDGFGPDVPITRAEIARMLVRARAVAGPVFVLRAEPARAVLTGAFSDAAKVDPGMVRYLAAAVEWQYLKGFPDRTARPADSASRSQAAVLVERLLNDLPGNNAPPPELPEAFDVWHPDPVTEPVDFSPALLAVDAALSVEGAAAGELQSARQQAATAAAEARALVVDAAVQGYQVSLAQDEVAGRNEYLNFPLGGWALWVGEQRAAAVAGVEPEFPAGLEDPELFGAWAGERLTAAENELAGALGGLEELQAQQAQATAGAEVTAGDAAGAARRLELAQTRTREEMDVLVSWARVALERGNCEEIRRVHAELLQRLQALQGELQLRQVRLQQAQADFVAADQVADQAEVRADGLEARAQQALDNMKAAAEALQDWYRNNINIPGVSFGPGAPAGWNYAGVSVHGVTLRETWFENNQAIEDFLRQTADAHKNPSVQAIRKRFNEARDAYRQAMHDLPAAKGAARSARATADAKQAALDAAQLQVNITQAEIAAVQALIDQLEALYQECLDRRAAAEQARQEAAAARARLQQAADQLEQLLGEARRARNAVADGLGRSGGPCPEAQELLRRANEAAARASEQRGRIGESDDLQRQAEGAAREAKRLADEARAALERCQQQRESQPNPDPGGRQVPDDEARELAGAIDEMNRTNDAREKAELAAKILEKLADWFASGKRLPDWLGKQVGLGGTAAGGLIDIGLTLIKAGPCPWLAIMVARTRALWIEHAGTPRESYYFLLWQRYASYYARNCAERPKPPR